MVVASSGFRSQTESFLASHGQTPQFGAPLRWLQADPRRQKPPWPRCDPS